MKICSKCKCPKELSNFSIRKASLDGLQGVCKQCQSLYIKVDYTIDQLKLHLEKKFTPEMSWDNYGSYWEIDHKIPIAVFNFEKPEDLDFHICWSLKNLQPLEKSMNRKKSAKIDIPFQPSLAIAV